jgi:hypothetical protein
MKSRKVYRPAQTMQLAFVAAMAMSVVWSSVSALVA